MEKTFFFLNKIAVFVLIFFVFQGISSADNIRLKSGKEIKGEISGSTARCVKIDYCGKEIYYKLDLIATINSVPPKVFLIEKSSPASLAGSYLRKNIDYGLETDAALISRALQEDLLDEKIVLPELRTVRDVTRDLFLGVIRNRYELIGNKKNFSPEYSYEQALQEGLDLIIMAPYAFRFYCNSNNGFLSSSDADDRLSLNAKLRSEACFDCEALYNLGLLYYFQGDHVRALPCFEELAELNEEHAGAYCFLGLLYYGRGEYSKGKYLLQRSGRLFRIKGEEKGADLVFSFLKHLP